MTSAAEALAALTISVFAVMLTDVSMAEMDGVELAATLLATGVPTRVLLWSGSDPTTIASRARHLPNVVGVVSKPCPSDQFVSCVQEALAKAERPP